MKIFVVIFFAFQVLDDFAAGQLNTMIPIGQSETFPIIHACKSICFTFYTVVLNTIYCESLEFVDLKKMELLQKFM
jgi:uncharacterized membrane protein (DUF485 family)